MFEKPCTFEEGMKQLKITAKNITYSLSQIAKHINGHSKFIIKVRKTMKDSIMAISSAVTQLSKQSANYYSCCKSLNVVYNTFYKMSRLHRNEDKFDEVVALYKEETLKSFAPCGIQVKELQEIFTANEGKMAELLTHIMEHTDANYRSVLADWDAALKSIQEKRAAAKRFLNLAVCLGATLFTSELRRRVGAPSYLARINGLRSR